MCGIAGFINFENSQELALKTNSIQQHRGPDNQGIWSENQVALCNQRLSIIDLNERSNQPLIKAGLVIVYNGELYNYQELRSDLSDNDGVRFTTDSDTEVVLEMYRKHGSTCLDYFLGMFSFAIYNRDTEKLFLARDHFGIKPLYYYHDRNQFAFASELKSLINLPGASKRLNRASLVGALNFSWVPGNETMLEGFLKLPPAHYLETTNASPPSLYRYWSLPTQVSSIGEEEWVDDLDNTLQESMKRHMVADVPVASFLSGGLDSSLISRLAQQHNPKLSTFTITTRAKDKKVEKMPDDEVYAAQLAQQYGFDHHQIPIEPEMVNDLPRIVQALDEPIGDPAAINTNLICSAARDLGIKVLLSGIGADEIFFGYRRQKATLLAAQYQKVPSGVRKPINQVINQLPVKIFGRGFKLGRWSKRFASFSDLPVPDAYLRSYSYYDRTDLEDLMVWPIDSYYQNLRDKHNQTFVDGYPGDLINSMCRTDLDYFLPGLNLSYTDRASMASSVEVRVPFVDKKVVEAAMKIPGSLKYKNGVSKHILKRVAERHLPAKIVHRPKASFGAPIRSWISGELSEMIDDLLSVSRIENRGIFDSKIISQMIRSDRKGSNDFAYQIYQLLTLELWFQAYLD